MGRIIGAINMTLDGYFDHTLLSPGEDVHQHYAELLHSVDAILYGRITYQLMQYWQPFIKNPSGVKSMDDFAEAIDRVEKIVFSRTLKDAGWESATLADQPIADTVRGLRKQHGRDILVGSRSLIVSLINLNLMDECQICIHPVLAMKGSPLFSQIQERTSFMLEKTKLFESGAIVLYYKPSNNQPT